MMEYEAEENDEELRNDAEYATALAELKTRLDLDEEDDDDFEDRLVLHQRVKQPGAGKCSKPTGVESMAARIESATLRATGRT